MMSESTPDRSAPQWLRPVVDYAPLAVFLITYLSAGLYAATAALVTASVIALALSFAVVRRVPWMPVVTAVVVAVFGGLTLWLNDDTFIKMKPTIAQGAIAAVLLGGLATGRALLKPVMGRAWAMDDAGWRRLTFRYALFFAAMAVLNEIVWRTQTTDVWVAFKVFGLLGLTFLFSLAQIPLMTRHRVSETGDQA
ncbi:MAG: septation protein A [Alphaproteobacteria bacterium]|nr:MAG: septation protein A [Alphaproteobacteria bacterium]